MGSNGKFKPLHKFNPVRLDYIKKSILKKFKNMDNGRPLNNIKILDIVCGGGLLCEPLNRLGACVVGIDASEKNIKIAKTHAKKNNLKINYYCATPENFISKIKFDVVLNMEIVEHVDNVDLFLKKVRNFKKEWNDVYYTLTKTPKSYVFAILGAEYILRWLPIGTHDWNMFINPEELERLCNKNSLSLEEIFGVKYNVISNNWHLSSDNKVNYMAKFKKI